jgi:hypothetical protein
MMEVKLLKREVKWIIDRMETHPGFYGSPDSSIVEKLKRALKRSENDRRGP